jgi:hypothetical protein
MYFDQVRPARAEQVLGWSRDWVQRAADHALAAFVLGPNLSFVATYGGDPALGVERAYGATRLGAPQRGGDRCSCGRRRLGLEHAERSDPGRGAGTGLLHPPDRMHDTGAGGVTRIQADGEARFRSAERRTP